MFSIREFIMRTINGMIGYYPDFQVMEYALNWYGKGKITEEDLATIEEWLEEAANPVAPEPEEADGPAEWAGDPDEAPEEEPEE